MSALISSTVVLASLLLLVLPSCHEVNLVVVWRDGTVRAVQDEIVNTAINMLKDVWSLIVKLYFLLPLLFIFPLSLNDNDDD